MLTTRKACYFSFLLLVLYLLVQASQLTTRSYVWKKSKGFHSGSKNREWDCIEKTNVAFVKTHKTGSTTLMNVIQRFGYTRNLTFVLPRGGLVYLGPHRLTLSSWTILPRPADKTFNILCNHAVYDRTTFREIMPSDTVYISILRHPLDRFLSAFWYYSRVYPQEYLVNIKGRNKVHQFLKQPQFYESGVEYTNNAMATDLGLAPPYFHHKPEILRYIRHIDDDFTLVLILELFDESLVLLKRKLCWSLKDILYVPKNKMKGFITDKTYSKSKLSRADIQRHERWDEADYFIYSHFHTKLLKHISDAGEDFKDEVTYFRKVRNNVTNYCAGNERTASNLRVPESKYHLPFEVSLVDCKLMLMSNEEKFTKVLIEKQYPDPQDVLIKHTA